MKSPGVPVFNEGLPGCTGGLMIGTLLVGESYFSGGYNTQRHGSVESGTIGGIQVECNQSVRFVEAARKDFADGFATVLLDYLIERYFPDLPSTYCISAYNDQPESPLVTVYPNPVTDLLYVNSLFPVNLRIYNLQGEVVCSETRIEGAVSLGKLPEGIYLVTVSTGGEIIFRGKIIRVNSN
ncbi:MAG: T9SS type A sorting domain-containing protein [Bacteroidales bacterium]